MSLLLQSAKHWDFWFELHIQVKMAFEGNV
jgi:hypothetical protein